MKRLPANERLRGTGINRWRIRRRTGRTGEKRWRSDGFFTPATVEHVTDDGEAEMSRMGANLVRSPSQRARADQTERLHVLGK